MADDRSLVLQRQRKLKWRALDWLESLLMMLCGATLIAFCTSVVCDIVTRTIGAPWLWLQEVTSTFFIYGIFIGAAVATRRNDHLFLAAVGDSFTGRPRLADRDPDPPGGDLGRASSSPITATSISCAASPASACRR